LKQQNMPCWTLLALLALRLRLCAWLTRLQARLRLQLLPQMLQWPLRLHRLLLLQRPRLLHKLLLMQRLLLLRMSLLLQRTLLRGWLRCNVLHLAFLP
jgi:hypothetical protein